MTKPLLEVEGLRVAFDAADAAAVDGMSLAVSSGETLALVGESGSGKSLVALAVLGLLPSGCAMSGTIRFNGEDLTAASKLRMLRLRGRDVGIVFQEPMTSLNPVLSVGEQVAERLRAHACLNRSQARQRAIEMLDRVRIPEPRRRAVQYPHQMSGGMRQRVMIAIALACGPRLLIADEPTTSLDVTVQAQILDLMQNLQRESGMAMLFITHDLGVVAEIADRVAVMHRGRAVESAPVKELFAQPRMPYTRELLDSRPGLAWSP